MKNNNNTDTSNTPPLNEEKNTIPPSRFSEDTLINLFRGVIDIVSEFIREGDYSYSGDSSIGSDSSIASLQAKATLENKSDEADVTGNNNSDSDE